MADDTVASECADVCLLCGNSASYSQTAMATSIDDPKEVGTLRVCVCKDCYGNLSAAERSFRLLCWVICIVFCVICLFAFSLLAAAILTVFGGIAILVVAYAFLQPGIVRKATDRAENLAKETGLKLSGLTDQWSPLQRPKPEDGGCDRCGSQDVSHVVRVVGTSFVKSDIKLTKTTDTYATQELDAAICSTCAGELKARTIQVGLVCGLAVMGGWALASYALVQYTNINTANLSDILPILVGTLVFVAGPLFFVCKVILISSVDGLWLRKTNTYKVLVENGLAASAIQVKGLPKRK